MLMLLYSQPTPRMSGWEMNAAFNLESGNCFSVVVRCSPANESTVSKIV